MGCFSYLSIKSGKSALSTSFDGSPCWLFKLYQGEVVEYMHGNYDSYGRVFNDKGDCFEWEMQELQTAMLLEDEWKEGDPFPTEPSEDDPNQGWGDNWEYLVFNEVNFKKVKNPKHIVFKHKILKAKLGKIDEEIVWYYKSKSYAESQLKISKEDKYINYYNEIIDNYNKDIEDLQLKKKELLSKSKKECEKIALLKCTVVDPAKERPSSYTDDDLLIK